MGGVRRCDCYTGTRRAVASPDHEHPTECSRNRRSASHCELSALPDDERSALRIVSVWQVSRPSDRGRRELAIFQEDLRLRFDSRPDLARLSSIGHQRRSRMVLPIPEGYHQVTPYLILNNAGDAIAFYKAALDASEVMRLDDPSGKVHHAEIRIGDSRIMLADEHPDMQALSPKTIGGSPVSIHLYVEDVDAAIEHAVAAGAKLIRPVADQFYGDRVGGIEDPFGYRWFIATHKEDLTMDEIRRRAAAQGR